ncbi:MAG: iron-sulfur cluster assembly scaffold protein [Geminicoccaceae bacterium]
MANPQGSATCDNPLCGDQVTLDLRLDGDRIAEIAQLTRGCVLTQAAASVLAERLAGADAAALGRAADEVRRLLAGETLMPAWPELMMFTPVHEVRSRHECVTLPFEAAAQALGQAASG